MAVEKTWPSKESLGKKNKESKIEVKMSLTQLSFWGGDNEPEEIRQGSAGWTSEGIIRPAPEPLVRVLNFSGGRQSSCLAEMIIRGDLPAPNLVLTADPGMEHAATYAHIQDIHERLNRAGVPSFVVPGPNLFDDLINLKKSGKTRVDNPPFWVKKANGGKGRLQQKCTGHYKIAPMDRFLRKWMEEHKGISSSSSRIGSNIVEKWIGFSADETRRISLPKQKYVFFRYPLIETGLTKEDCVDYMRRIGAKVPPPSVCVGCFANTAEHFRAMTEDDFAKAQQVDEAVRDLSVVGVHGEIYVSQTLTPLSEVRSGKKSSQELSGGSCDSGYCFI